MQTYAVKNRILFLLAVAVTGAAAGSATTSTGYGDLVPLTPLGRLIGFVVMALSIALVAIPGGIFTAGFIEEMRRQEMERNAVKRPGTGASAEGAAAPPGPQTRRQTQTKASGLITPAQTAPIRPIQPTAPTAANRCAKIQWGMPPQQTKRGAHLSRNDDCAGLQRRIPAIQPT